MKIDAFIYSLFLLLLTQLVVAQEAGLKGQVFNSEGSGIAFAAVGIPVLEKGSATDLEGSFYLQNLAEGEFVLRISAIGYQAIELKVELKNGEVLGLETIVLKEDILGIGEVVVTGTRDRVSKYNSAVIINTIGAKTFEATQSMNVADGLNFSPGLRVENNCQNCGFTQLRMNGLDGPYSQVLINSRPVFSALAGVYGLEMLPTNMVDRIEVVRGGGSVMYGGNAIAGTVNIITKDPFENSFEVGMNQSFINAETSDRSFNFNGSIVSEDRKKGISFFGFNRNRGHWDANGDGFSEIVALRNNTFGFDAFYNLNEQTKVRLGAYYINEFRRGGNKFDLFPHQTDVTEQLEHDILSTNLSVDHLSKNKKHKFSIYASLQHVNRSSYYGGGGRVIQEGDSLTADDILAINAYGTSQDISTVSGMQYNYYINSTFSLTAGTEYVFNEVIDEMPGYARIIDQAVGTWGTFAELEVNPIKQLTFLVGGRFDYLTINGSYDLAGETFNNQEAIPIFVPRFTAMYSIKENLKLRASFAQGYRGPQAFDEDLHIETVGGAARFIQIDPNLELERSNSAVLSLNYDKYLGKTQMNFVIEGFYTKLNNPFILVDQTELPSGIAVINKENGSAATVMGTNIEANVAFGSQLVIQSGATIQSALYDEEEEIWAPDAPSGEIQPTTTTRLLRTPNTYGYLSLVYNPIEAFSLSYSAVLTGTMDVAHVIDPDTEETVIKRTPTFFENNIKLAYTFHLQKHYKFELFGGVQNIFNSYQHDFDLGADRDAGYVYGPMRPRTIFVGLKFGLD
jgi:outer membrane receptor for ferrienterochelin and colicins